MAVSHFQPISQSGITKNTVNKLHFCNEEPSRQPLLLITK